MITWISSDQAILELMLAERWHERLLWWVRRAEWLNAALLLVCIATSDGIGILGAGVMAVALDNVEIVIRTRIRSLQSAMVEVVVGPRRTIAGASATAGVGSTDPSG